MHEPEAHQDPYEACFTCVFSQKNPCPRTRRDKYEKDKIEFWVEEETKGSYKISHTEAWNDRREMDLTDDMQDLDGEASHDDADDDSDDDEDAVSSESSGSSDSSTKGKKGKRAGKSNKKKKEKKDKRHKKVKKAKKEKKSNVSSPSSKAGSPKSKSEALEEEARSEAPVVN